MSSTAGTPEGAESSAPLPPRLADLTSLFQDAPIGLALLDAQACYVYVNRYLAALNRRPVADHIGRSVDEVIPRFAAEVRAVVQQVLHSEEPIVETEVDVGSAHRLVSYYPVRSAHGDRVDVGIVLQDVTRRVAMEEALRQSEEKFQTIYEHGPIMIDSFDEQGRCVLWNHECERNLGWTHQEATSREDPLAMFYPERAERDRVFAAIQSADGVFREYLVRAKDGGTRVQLWANFRLPNAHLMSVGIDITGRKRAEEQLQRAREELEQRVEERTRELREANAALEMEVAQHRQTEQALLQHREQLRALASKLSLAEESERRRIAADLHDHIVQNLGLARMRLGRLRTALASEMDLEVLQSIEVLVGQTIHDSRSLIFEVSPPVLYEFGLEAALEWLADRTERQHDLRCTVEDDEQPKPLGEDVMVVLFQAARELLANVGKHARASAVKISIAARESKILVCIEDDGIGFDASAAADRNRPQTFGLFSIRERLSALGGGMEIDSAPGRGTRIVLTAPMRSNS